MIPSFIPIVGSNFDSIANQQAGWQNFNRGVEENNLARMGRAQEEQNNWLTQLATLQRRDADQMRQEQGSDEARAYQAQADAESRRRFDVGTALSEKQLAADEKSKQWHFDLAKAERDRNIDDLDRIAEFKAADAQEYAKARKDAAEELKASQADLETAASKVDTGGGSIIRDRTGKYFVANPKLFGEDAAKAATRAETANQSIAAVRAAHDKASTDYAFHVANWNKLLGDITSSKLKVNDDGTIQNPYSGRTFGKPIKAIEAPSAPAPEPQGQLPDWLRPRFDLGTPDMTPSGPNFFSRDLSGTSAPPAASTSMAVSSPRSNVQRVVRGPDGKLVIVPVNPTPAFDQSTF